MKLIKSLVKFLQEFVDARKRSVQTAPQVLYSHIEPPLDIQSVTTTTNTTNKKDNYGYVTFVLFPRHLVLNKRENCISHIELFRSYFHYHIKCSKAYMHSRMRFRVKEYLKILNRAKPENLDDEGKVIENRKPLVVEDLILERKKKYYVMCVSIYVQDIY